MTKKIKLIYITSCSRSGSTLLNFLLGSHSDAFSIGEGSLHIHKYANLKKVSFYDPSKPENQCSCGADDIYKCPVWSKIDERYKSLTGLNLKDKNLNEAIDDFDHLNESFYRAITEITGKNYIVDASKSLTRLIKLLKIPTLDVYPIHLTRAPKAQVYSVYRVGRQGYKETALLYTSLNLKRNLVLGNKRHLKVYYDNIVKDPEKEIKRIMEYAGLDFEKEQLDWAAKTHHNIDGNRLRLKLKDNASSEIKADESWIKGLSSKQKLVIDLITAPAVFTNYVLYKLTNNT